MKHSAVVPFQFNEHPVRTVVRNGEPWFVAKDVCAVLNLDNHREAVKRLLDEELGSEILTSGGQRREMIVVSESGLYRLIFRSNKPDAEKFRKWVFSEVLPSIRKTGQYVRSGRQGQLHPDKLSELGFAARNASRIAVAMGVYGHAQKRRVVSDLVLEATGYDLQQQLQSLGAIPALPDEEGDVVKSYLATCFVDDPNGRETSRAVYEGFLYYFKNILEENAIPPNIVEFNRHLRQHTDNLQKRGGVLYLLGKVFTRVFRADLEANHE